MQVIDFIDSDSLEIPPNPVCSNTVLEQIWNTGTRIDVKKATLMGGFFVGT